MDTKYPWLLLLELQFNDAQDRVARFVRNYEDLWWYSEKYWASDCVAHFKMNDNAANKTVIESANGLNGTSQRNTNLMSVAGKVNTALYFNGEDDYIRVTDNDLLDFGTSDFAISFRLKCSNKGAIKSIIEKQDASVVGWEVDISLTDKLQITIGDSSGYTVQTFNDIDPTDGFWHHVVLNFDRDVAVTPYYDGVAKTPKDITARQGSVNNDSILAIGIFRNLTSYKYKGALDDIRLYKRLLTTTEIAALYNNGNGAEYGEQPYWQKLAEA